ncbi:DNA damage-inducible transcript 3 protein [Heterodontus francisci]|uniref:DNA damage-inducible transcript 3 protein n=1 Tax=Heterodontus francisci TaxID=7792 RepID=UPI00355B2816
MVGEGCFTTTTTTFSRLVVGGGVTTTTTYKDHPRRDDDDLPQQSRRQLGVCTAASGREGRGSGGGGVGGEGFAPRGAQGLKTQVVRPGRLNPIRGVASGNTTVGGEEAIQPLGPVACTGNRRRPGRAAQWWGGGGAAVVTVSRCKAVARHQPEYGVRKEAEASERAREEIHENGSGDGGGGAEVGFSHVGGLGESGAVLPGKARDFAESPVGAVAGRIPPSPESRLPRRPPLVGKGRRSAPPPPLAPVNPAASAAGTHQLSCSFRLATLDHVRREISPLRQEPAAANPPPAAPPAPLQRQSPEETTRLYVDHVIKVDRDVPSTMADSMPSAAFSSAPALLSGQELETWLQDLESILYPSPAGNPSEERRKLNQLWLEDVDSVLYPTSTGNPPGEIRKLNQLWLEDVDSVLYPTSVGNPSEDGGKLGRPPDFTQPAPGLSEHCEQSLVSCSLEAQLHPSDIPSTTDPVQQEELFGFFPAAESDPADGSTGRGPGAVGPPSRTPSPPGGRPRRGARRRRSGGPARAGREAREQGRERRVAELTEENERLRGRIEQLTAEVQEVRRRLVERMVNVS